MPNTLDEVNSKLNLIVQVLQGKIEDRDDSGLIGDVDKNTTFRENTEAGRNKAFWVSVSAFIGLIAKILYDALK